MKSLELSEDINTTYLAHKLISSASRSKLTKDKGNLKSPYESPNCSQKFSYPKKQKNSHDLTQDSLQNDTNMQKAFEMTLQEYKLPPNKELPDSDQEAEIYGFDLNSPD